LLFSTSNYGWDILKDIRKLKNYFTRDYLWLIVLAAIRSALTEAVCIVGIQLFGIIPPFWGRNTTNAKNAGA